jgi:hypothetical protein
VFGVAARDGLFFFFFFPFVARVRHLPLVFGIFYCYMYLFIAARVRLHACCIPILSLVARDDNRRS